MTILKSWYAPVALLLLCAGCQPPAGQQNASGAAQKTSAPAIRIDQKNGKAAQPATPPDMGCTNGVTPAGQPCAPATRGPG